MTMQGLSLVLATTAVLALNPPAFAEAAKGPNIGISTEGTTHGVAATMSLAQDLYRLGVRQGDALTVLSAARLAASVDFEEQTPAPLELPADQLAAIALTFTTLPPQRQGKGALTMSGDPAARLATIGTAPTEDTEGASD